MAKAVIILADGFEEIEALSVIDILRRAKIDIKTAAIRDGYVESARGVRVIADVSIDDVKLEDYAAIILPGGQPGADNLSADQRVRDLLQRFYDADQLVCAICAAPFILADMGILDGKRATCYPAYAERLVNAKYLEDPVVEDGNVITSRGPATAPDFGFKIAERMVDRRMSDTLKKAMLYES
ncbi:DJ-1 family glyoxalase III [Limisalsivibrio acetivorans]|uniref:DJ-1 family glyoxalase III n=1 Tax=Limisalsivibrio acetivorans TaxID=1304888 RepID=UPI0003B6C0A6|nr:DJ-1 family glyoxalase III [Limisalsivibrio acetivorans]